MTNDKFRGLKWKEVKFKVWVLKFSLFFSLSKKLGSSNMVKWGFCFVCVCVFFLVFFSFLKTFNKTTKKKKRKKKKCKQHNKRITTISNPWAKNKSLGWMELDVAKWAGQVRFGSGQSGLRVKRVTGQNGSFLNGSIGLRVRLDWPVFFIFFFQLQKQINDNLFREND